MTLSQLSDTGIVRAVRRLKSEPDEIGLRARRLLEKWRAHINEYVERDPNSKNEKKDSKPKGNLKEKKHSLTSEPGFRIPSQSPAFKSLKRRPSPEPFSPSLDASSGLSFEQAMRMSVPVKKKPKKCSKCATQSSTSNSDEKQNQRADSSRYPSRAFTEEILQSLADPFERPDVQQKPTQRHSGLLMHLVERRFFSNFVNVFLSLLPFIDYLLIKLHILIGFTINFCQYEINASIVLLLLISCLTKTMTSFLCIQSLLRDH